MNNIQLGKDKISKIFWLYAIPSILTMIAQSTAMVVDSIFVGQFIGPKGLSAITLFFPLVGIFIGVGTMFAIGGTTLAGIELGKGNREKSNNLFNTIFFILTGLSLIGTIAVYFGIGPMVRLLNTEDILKTYVIDYGQTLSFFFVFFMLNFALSFFLKLDGKPLLVVIIMVSGTLINIILDYLFIYQFGMGLKGAALATGASQLIPWFLLMFNVIKKSHWKFKKPKFHFDELKMIVFNGSSEFLTNMTVSITGIIFNMIIIRRVGVIGLAGFAVCQQIVSIASSLGYGFAESCSAAISYNFGAEQLNRVKTLLRYTLKANITGGILLFIMAFFFGDRLASIFVNDTETIQIATNILKYYGVSFVFVGMNITFATFYTAVNDPLSSAGISFYRSFVGILLGLLILPLAFGNTGIWLSIVFVELTTFLIGLILIKKLPFGNYKNKMILKERIS